MSDVLDGLLLGVFVAAVGLGATLAIAGRVLRHIEDCFTTWMDDL